jgi:hypothetical protein
MEGFPLKLIIKVHNYRCVPFIKRRGYKLRIKKKTAMALSFTIGTMLFATTAFAEINSKNGYDQLKDSLKFTAEGFSEKLSSYTLNLSFVIKDNDVVMASKDYENKSDLSKNAAENNSKYIERNTKKETYSYTDKNGYITYYPDSDSYEVTEFNTPKENPSFENPFKEKEAVDIEKIADAVIGNLKDYVVISENPDGSKELSGSLSQAQIPAIANALASFQFKREYLGNRNPNIKSIYPNVTQDIFVKEVTGKMVVDKNGLMQSALGTGVLSGKDEQGKEHTLTFEILAKVSDVNSTVVNKPDLSGKKVEKRTAGNYNAITNPETYLGKYKNDIIIRKDGKFEKIGESFLELIEVNDKTITGRYHEVYKNGYENYKINGKDFTFSAIFNDKDHYNAPFESNNASGQNYKGELSTNNYSPSVYFSIGDNSIPNRVNDGNFNRVFD